MSNWGLSRRDFLKLGGMLPGAALLGRDYLVTVGEELPSFIILVFDALSAHDLSVYGYSRDTAPNLTRFANRALVYHQHSSAGNYTTPGTASLLTGMVPWTHRALNQSSRMRADLGHRNVFSALGPRWNRYGFAQNPWADLFLHQFSRDVDTHLPVRSFGAISPWLTGDGLEDGYLAYQALDSFLFSKTEIPGSMFFALGERIYGSRFLRGVSAKDYPRGYPEVVTGPFSYRLDDLVSGVADFCRQMRPPFLAYLHLQPPHEPYRATKAYSGFFNDDVVGIAKPRHRLVISPDSEEHLATRRAGYDRFIANLDAELGKLLETLEESGLFNHCYVLLTSDHGEMFERGQRGHSTPLLYEPVIHIPLLIAGPRIERRVDIQTPTSAVDILPSVLHLAGQPVPSWCEGHVLPGLGFAAESERVIFAVEAKSSPANRPLTRATASIRQGPYKLIYYRGYEEENAAELYNLEQDPEELEDLHAVLPGVAASLEEVLLEHWERADLDYA